MIFNDIIIGFIDIISSTGPNKLDKFIELEEIEIEESKEEKNIKILAINKTITSCEEKVKPMDMNVYHYEYSKTWWKRKYGHFNEELYRRVLDRRAPELR